jgi:hypothetical protein
MTTLYSQANEERLHCSQQHIKLYASKKMSMPPSYTIDDEDHVFPNMKMRLIAATHPCQDKLDIVILIPMVAGQIMIMSYKIYQHL